MAKTRKKRKQAPNKVADSSDFFEVEDFVDFRKVRKGKGARGIEILLKWKSYPLDREDQDSWKLASDLMQDTPVWLTLWARSQGYSWPWLLTDAEMEQYEIPPEMEKYSKIHNDSTEGQEDDHDSLFDSEDEGRKEEEEDCKSHTDSLFGSEAAEEEDLTGGGELVWPTLKPPAKKRLQVPLDVAKYKGEPIEIIMHESQEEQYFLKYHFGARIMIQDTILTPQVHSLLPTLELQGATYQLVASKLVRGTGKQGRYLLMQQPKVRAYYIRENVKTANLSVKQELEKLGCFDGILPSKIAARMELTVSPIAKYGSSSKNPYPLSFLLSGKEIELIKENGNVGCGFIPQNYLKKWFKTASVTAIQVRIFSPQHGWAKGMLVAKTKIQKIQLPSSMIKVQPSKAARPHSNVLSVFLGINAYFPSKSSEMMGRALNPNLPNPPTSAEGKLKHLVEGEQLWNLLLGNGVEYEALCRYANESKAWERRNHCSCVGVVDPTGKIPSGCVFLTGQGTVQGLGLGLTQTTFISRYPCTCPEDGLLVQAVQSRPKGMNESDWEFLRDLPFGLLVFSSLGDIPARTAGGDLDGDQYIVLFDNELIKSIESRNTSISPADVQLDTTEEDSLLGCDLVIGKDRATVLHRKEGDNEKYIVSVGKKTREMTKDEILEGDKGLVDKIVAHTGTGRDVKIELQWSDGSTTSGQLSEYTLELEDILVQYAKANNLLDLPGWRSLKNLALKEAFPCHISNHRMRSNQVQVLVGFDNGEEKWMDLGAVPEDGMDLVVSYASTKKVINLKCWEKAKSHIQERNTLWFENTQAVMGDLPVIRDQDRLTTTLHSAYRHALNQHMDQRIVQGLGQAFKDSIDIRKHGGKVVIPRGLKSHVREERLHAYIIEE